MGEKHELGQVAHIAPEAIGQPGQRRFRLRALSAGGEFVSLWLEKEQLAAVGDAIESVLEDAEYHYERPPMDDAEVAPVFPLDADVEMRLSQLSMGVNQDDRLIVGTETGLREFRNVPAVAARLDPPGRHDAVYVLRNHHVTAAIDVHDLALGGGECWYVNTLFSCLCTLDPDLSFVPRWRPRFVTSLAPEDRCHLNGLAMVDGRPAFLTALGATDTPEGWRANKKNGGVLIDHASRETIADGLSMPHSPRWYRDRLWLLESGRGSLATVDLATGAVETVAQLPGFTRGLDFAGPLAFVGLSQLRASNPFTDIPITDDNAERASGVWVVHIETGETVAFLKFSASVEEIFTVQALAGVRRPAIVDEEDEAIKATNVLPDDAPLD
jgi:uncharacterized protein (TIGR03032 family)